jgi:uncharacterized protein (DUF934 family)
MQNLIKGNQLVTNDAWEVFDAERSENYNNALLPISFWQEQAQELSHTTESLGAYVQEDETIESLIPHLPKLAVIGFSFSKFVDGRAFSYARELRLTHGFTGEIRAMGDFLPDQVNYLQRCGFDAYAMRTALEVDIALSIKDAVSVVYQSDTRERKPLFRRR